MSRSNSPQVLGLVIITAATSGPSRAFSAARSTRPSAVAGMSSTREAGEGRGRGVGAVRGFGDEHDLAVPLAALLQRRLDAQDAAQFTVRAGLGRHRDAVHAGQLDQPDRQFVDDRQRALHGIDRLRAGGRRRSRAAAPSARSAADCASSCTSRAGTGRGRSRNSGAIGGCSGGSSPAPTGRPGRSARCARDCRACWSR